MGTDHSDLESKAKGTQMGRGLTGMAALCCSVHVAMTALGLRGPPGLATFQGALCSTVQRVHFCGFVLLVLTDQRDTRTFGPFPCLFSMCEQFSTLEFTSNPSVTRWGRNGYTSGSVSPAAMS